MTAPLGLQQLRILILVASPTCVMMTPDKVSAALVRRGLLRQDHYRDRDGRDRAGSCAITPEGLRALAAAMEAGRVAGALDRMKAEARKRKSSSKRGA